MTDQKPTDWKRDARSVVLALAAGAAIVAPTATPLMAASLDELRGGVTEMLNAPPNHVRAFQDLVGRKLMHSGYGEAASRGWGLGAWSAAMSHHSIRL